MLVKEKGCRHAPAGVMATLQSRRYFIIENDEAVIALMRMALETAGHTVIHETHSPDILAHLQRERPDCVIMDIMMPGMDGLEFLRKIRSARNLDDVKVVVVSAKSYEFDRRRAISFGADGFIAKPIDPALFVRQLESLLDGTVEMTFWGVRGTLPVPGPRALRYGGNTNCMTLEFPQGQFFIFDAGTGIKALSDHLMAERRSRLDYKLFLSHPHWDHINGLPFFVPAYIPGNELQIFGVSHGDRGVKELVSDQMDDVYFPVTMKEFGARLEFRDLHEETFEIDGIRIQTMLLIHPGYCLGYRVEYQGRSICYVTDNEFFPATSPRNDPHNVAKLRRFVSDADVLITDCTYTDEEYPSKIGWGHSAVGAVVDFAHAASVKALYLYHHDPGQDDDDIDGKLAFARKRLNALGSMTQAIAPSEGVVFKV